MLVLQLAGGYCLVHHIHQLGQSRVLEKEVVGGSAAIGEVKLEWVVIQVVRWTAGQQGAEIEEEAGKGMKGTTRRQIDESPLLVVLVPLGIQHLVKSRQECAFLNFD
jgi:hypothetical protein